MTSQLLGYDPGHQIFDEALDADGRLRPTWSVITQGVLDTRPGVLDRRRAMLDRLLEAEGAGHLLHHGVARTVAEPDTNPQGPPRPWLLDPLPWVVGRAEFDRLAAGVIQRMRLLEAVLTDLDDEASLITSGILPPDAVYATSSAVTTLVKGSRPTWLVHAAFDVARTATGNWRLVADHTDVPEGLAAALIDRAAMARILPDEIRTAGVAPLGGIVDDLRAALATCAPAGVATSRTVVLSAGVDHPGHLESSYLATRLGYHLVEGGDLVVRQGRVWLRSLEALEPVDVVLRRVPDPGLDPLAARATGTAGVPAITWAAHRGGVALANARGSRLAQEPTLAAWLAPAAHHLLGEDLALEPLGPEEKLATAPVHHPATDTIVPGHVVVRLHVVSGPDGPVVMPGGTARVLDRDEHDVAVLKDVWVLGGATQRRPRPPRVRQPQVDLLASLPKRSADALYWLGRGAERVEVAARAARVVGAQIDQDPELVDLDQGAWARRAIGLLRAARSLPPIGPEDPEEPVGERLRRELVAIPAFVGTQVMNLAQEADAVREYLSSTTARVLGRLAGDAAGFGASNPGVDDLDVVLSDLAALSGLATESMLRSPAWRMMDMGRRLERGLAVLGSVEAALGGPIDEGTLQTSAESVLAANESLIAYRRRHRSDVELPTLLALIVHDDANPRSLAFQLDRLREHVAALSWPEGSALVERASRATMSPVNGFAGSGESREIETFVLEVRGPLLDLGEAVVQRWFSDPVNPMRMLRR